MDSLFRALRIGRVEFQQSVLIQAAHALGLNHGQVPIRRIARGQQPVARPQTRERAHVQKRPRREHTGEGERGYGGRNGQTKPFPP